MLINVLLLIAGLVILYFGAEWLVAGASKIALGFGVSPLIVGLTIVAFATSAPEFVVSLLATLRGSSDLAMGNVIGSNVANVALIVGVASIVLPMQVERTVLTRDYPIMVLIMILATGAAYIDQNIVWWEGLVLIGVLVFFLTLCMRTGLKQSREYKQTAEHAAVEHEDKQTLRNIGLCVVGLACLVGGAQLMVSNAVIIARAFDISELVIGVSIVAIGTSLPELATSIVAALRNEPDIGLGNIVGSNIFNVGFILGGVSLIQPLEVAEQALRVDLPIMLGIILLLFPLMRSSYRISRFDGAILVLVYIGYLVTSYLAATGVIGSFGS